MTPVIHIGIPLHDGRIHEQCMRGVLEAWNCWPCTLTTVVGSFLPRSRDRIIAEFLDDATATHLLCVDSDMEWHASDLEKLLALETPFTFGGYVGKRPGAPMMASRHVGSRHCDGVTVDEYERCGAGFVLLRRPVVLEMVGAYQETDSYVDSDGRYLVGLWQTSGRVELDGRTVGEGEDYAFCRRWRSLGGRIFTRPDVRLGHVGSATWR